MKLSEQEEKDWPLEMRAAYESDWRKILVVESMWAFWGGSSLCYQLFPSTYGDFMERTPFSSLGRLYTGKAPVWRPCVYEYRLGGGEIRRLSSQMELEWRYGIVQAGMLQDLNATPEDHQQAWAEPHDRAVALLRENLTPQQVIDLYCWGMFFVHGEVNKLYGVEPGNGFSICDPTTREKTVTCCFHPDQWIPHEDVALATKLLLEQGASGEEEVLAACRSNPLPWEKRDPTKDELVAAALEVDMY